MSGVGNGTRRTALVFAAGAGIVLVAVGAWLFFARGEGQDTSDHDDADRVWRERAEGVLDAIWYGRYEGVRELLDIDPTLVAARDPETGAGILHAAARAFANPDSARDAAKIFELARARGADIAARDRRGTTPLHVAADASALPIVRLLIEAGADVNAVNEAGTTPLHFAAQREDAEIIEALRAAGANIHAENRYAMTPLFMAAEAGRVWAVGALCDAGARIDACDYRGWTPLHAAVETNSRRVLRRLLGAGADPNARDRAGDTPLVVACREINGIAAQELLAHGSCDARAADACGRAPLCCVIEEAASRMTAYQRVVREEWRAASPEERPMYQSCEAREQAFRAKLEAHARPIVRGLLAHGADPGARGGGGRTPRAIAEEAGLEELAALLREGAPPQGE